MMKRKKRLSAALLALGICISLISPVPAKAAEVTENTGISTNAIPGWPQAQDITSTAAVVVEESTSTILYAKHGLVALSFQRRKNHDLSCGS